MVSITGTVTITTDANGVKTPSRSADVSVSAQADPNHRWDVKLLEKHFGRDKQFDLKFADDERLIGNSYTSTGVGAKLVSAGLRVGTLALSLAPAAAALLDKKPPNELEQQFAIDHPELAARRDLYKGVVGNLETALAAAAQAAADSASDDGISRLQGIAGSLTDVLATSASLDAQFETWLAAKFPAWVQRYAFSLGTDELPSLPKLPTDVWVPAAGELTGPAAEAATALGIVVARIGDAATQETTKPAGDSMISYRVPRRISLAVFEDANPGSRDRSYRVRNLMPAWVVDKYSPIESVAIESHLFHTDGATVEFGDAGTLTRLGNKETSAAGAIATTLSGAGADITDSLDQATKIAGALPGDPALKALQNDVTRKELEARLVKANRTIAGLPEDQTG